MGCNGQLGIRNWRTEPQRREVLEGRAKIKKGVLIPVNYHFQLRMVTHMPIDIFNRQPKPAAVRVPYGSDPNQFGDLRLPQRSTADTQHPKLPTVVFIHGGFWRARYDLTHIVPAAIALTEAGVATWNIEYRRLGNAGGGWPGTFLDVGDAVDHLREIAPEYGLDLQRVVVVGHSAGGHLAAWVAARHRIPMGDPLYNDRPLPVKAAVPLAGVVDLHMGWDMDLSNGVVEELIGGTPEGLLHRYATASPIEMLPAGVPQVLIHGTDDANVPYEISRHYVEVATLRGDNVRLLTLPGAGHFEVVDPASAEWQQVLGTVLSLV